MIVKRIFCLAAALALSVSLASCGEKESVVLNYEQPIAAMKGALDNGDEISYLCCYLPQAKAEYMRSDEYSPDFIDSAIDKNSVISRVRIKITDSAELAEGELETLESDAKERYGTRFDFTKGQRLNVDILVDTRKEELCDSRELTVVRYDNVWYIYGDVLDSFSFLPREN